jgi:hypothetical protein
MLVDARRLEPTNHLAARWRAHPLASSLMSSLSQLASFARRLAGRVVKFQKLEEALYGVP